MKIKAVLFTLLFVLVFGWCTYIVITETSAPLTAATETEESHSQPKENTPIPPVSPPQDTTEKAPVSSSLPAFTTKRHTPTATASTESKGPETTEKKDGSVAEWSGPFLRYATIQKTDFDRFALVCVNSDDIPELYMIGSGGAKLLTWSTSQKAILEQKLNSPGEAHYIPRSGKFMNVSAGSNHLTLTVFDLTDSFRHTFKAWEYKTVEADGSITYRGYASNNSRELTEDQLKEETQKYIDTNQTVSIHKELISFDQLQEKLK